MVFIVACCLILVVVGWLIWVGWMAGKMYVYCLIDRGRTSAV